MSKNSIPDVRDFINQFLTSDEYLRIIETRDQRQTNIEGDTAIKWEADIINEMTASLLLTKSLFESNSSLQIVTILTAIAGYHHWLIDHFEVIPKK